MEKVVLKVENGQPVVSSRKVANDFEKRHSHVVEAIDNKIESLTTENSEVKISKLFIPTTFNHNGNDYKEYLLTRDGFTFIVMGFTGAKADSWKFKYIEAFNKMEQYIKEKQKPKCIEDVLIQSLQEMKDVKYQLETVKKEGKETKEEVQAIRDVITINPKEEWRKETNKLIGKICYKLQDYKTPKDEIYRALEERAKCKLSIRLKNLQARAALNGMAQSQIDKLNNLDVIANDVRLKEIYISIVSQIAIKQGIKL
ncbi:Gp26 protein [Clostridium sporogenes]|uniref:Phage regulatory protein, Rha family n=1 Tax=Clostridium sporogenes TaxID=1509 RepID=A0A7U4LNV1_CLOSG|nr:Rha family transcriptional regulator [Clostridium sporogenes]MDU1421952.1 Rha family transcriptional regulator [Clostridium botulinum]AKC63209.1 phage regulatory protein, Rha family [Clostridium sporogenes]AKJ90391.1 antirepressor [Clostridium sporogenes]KCZ67896.1 phage regulatory protein, Rha family [Clostridium sporogenes]OOO65453.1 phage antirepressor Ant [Clostridium sporogenes]